MVVGVDCSDMSELSHWPTCRPVGKRGTCPTQSKRGEAGAFTSKRGRALGTNEDESLAGFRRMEAVAEPDHALVHAAANARP